MTEVPAPDIPQNDLSPFELPALTSEIMEPTFKLLLMLTHPPKRVRTNNRKTKNVKSESENKGPYEISVNIGWDNFLGVVAEKLMVVPSSLVITSFAWHWVKPASSPWLPLQDENGFASMLKKVKTKVKPYVIIRMSAPTERKAAESSGNAWDVVDELDSDLEDNMISKKAKLDDALEEIVAKLANKYAPRLCNCHQDLPCFHHHTSDLHFNLDRPRLLVWAQAIKSGTATYEKVPMLSPMFKSSLALKHVSKNTGDSDTASATASVPPATATQLPMSTQFQMPITPFVPFTQYPQAFPQMYAPMPPSPFMNYGSGMPYAGGNPFFDAGATGTSSSMASLRPSPPSLPTPSCTIVEFCDTYNLGEHAEMGLEKLGFRFGDNLNALGAEEYKEVGFKPLEWKRVLKAYRRLKQDTRLT